MSSNNRTLRAAAFSEEQLCVRCARSGGTCCQRAHVFLTLGDVRRIRESGVDDPFFEYRIMPGRMAGEDTGRDPPWESTFRPDGTRRVVARRENGDCRFLLPDGCSLPLTARPLVCRLYPYEYTPETIKGVYAPLCPHPERDNPPLLLAMLGLNRNEAETWRQLLYREILEEFPGNGETHSGNA